jgi:hypothetical protein
MNFKMYSDSFDFAEVNEAVIRQAIAELAKGKLEFLVLEAGQAVDGNAYIQTAVDDGDFILETRFIYHENMQKPKLFTFINDVKYDDYKHYQKTGLTASEVEKAFLDYIKGINPDVTEDGWELMEI